MGIRAFVTIAAAAAVGVAVLAVRAQSQPQPQPQAGQPEPGQPAQAEGGFPDLASGLKTTPGCLGVEMARTASGKNLIFAWFQDKRAVMRWYGSEMHQQAMDTFFPHNESAPDHHAPLEGLADDFGPVMAIASITMADQSKFQETSLPVSQIAIELYAPLSGGLFLGSRFAPEGVKVPDMTDYTPR